MFRLDSVDVNNATSSCFSNQVRVLDLKVVAGTDVSSANKQVIGYSSVVPIFGKRIVIIDSDGNWPAINAEGTTLDIVVA